MTGKISQNMEQTNQEINETVQTASHRIFNHMLKNIELNKECNQIDMIRKNSQNEPNPHTIVNPDVDPHCNDKMKMKLQFTQSVNLQQMTFYSVKPLTVLTSMVHLSQ